MALNRALAAIPADRRTQRTGTWLSMTKPWSDVMAALPKKPQAVGRPGLYPCRVLSPVDCCRLAERPGPRAGATRRSWPPDWNAQWGGTAYHGGESRTCQACLSARKTLEDFDFSHQRSVKREVIAHLGDPRHRRGEGQHGFSARPALARPMTTAWAGRPPGGLRHRSRMDSRLGEVTPEASTTTNCAASPGRCCSS